MICEKTKYLSRTEAKNAIAGINNDKLCEIKIVDNLDKIPAQHRKRSKKSSMKAYFCNDCNGWHIATQGKKSKRRKPSTGNGIINIKTVQQNKPAVLLIKKNNIVIK